LYFVFWFLSIKAALHFLTPGYKAFSVLSTLQPIIDYRHHLSW
jgi:hypothetical protein